VPALILRTRATWAIGLPISRTIRTVPSRNSSSNRLHVSDKPLPTVHALPPRFLGIYFGTTAHTNNNWPNQTKNLLVERRREIFIYPKARNPTFPSFEIFRSLGLSSGRSATRSEPRTER
jgi:hypothetical protein